MISWVKIYTMQKIKLACLSVWIISNHKHDIDTDNQIHIYIYSQKYSNGYNFWYTKCHKPNHEGS
jgi:hypothetical protein